MAKVDEDGNIVVRKLELKESLKAFPGQQSGSWWRVEVKVGLIWTASLLTSVMSREEVKCGGTVGTFF